ncbi:ABC transporter substrate-binding protein [Ideonella sp.]|uniref:ABC transporter substrate-binding protein n=1 Tax=Ideonella sp. TaxID=1929293 RepID=UPI003BB711F7
MSRRRVLCAGGAAGLAALGGCDPAPPAPAGLQTLRWGLDLWPGFFPGVLADELGWHKEAGIALQLTFPENTDRMLADFSAGHYDLICASLGDLVHITRGQLAAQVLAVCDESAGGDAVLLRPGGKLDERLPLRIGTNLGGFGEVFVREFLAQRRLSDQRWIWVNVDAGEVPALLAAGEVDIAHTWAPYVGKAEAAGATRLFDSRSTPGLIADVLMATQATVQRRGDVLRAFLRNWFRAVDWWMENPAQARTLIARRAKVAEETVNLEGVRLLDLAENRGLLGADGRPAALLPVVQRYSEFYLSKGGLARALDAPKLLRADLLP